MPRRNMDTEHEVPTANLFESIPHAPPLICAPILRLKAIKKYTNNGNQKSSYRQYGRDNIHKPGI